MHGDKIMFVVTQRDVETQDPEPDDLYRVGTVVEYCSSCGCRTGP